MMSVRNKELDGLPLSDTRYGAIQKREDSDLPHGLTPRDQRSVSIVMIIILSLITVGGHTAKNSFPVLQTYLLRDGFVTSAGYGMILSAQSIPVMIVPFFIGHLYDHVDYKMVTIVLLLISLFGQFLFAIAVGLSSFYLAIFAQIISGIGISSIIVAQRALIAENFKVSLIFTLLPPYPLQNRVALGIGISVAMASISKILSKATMAPLVVACGSYKTALFVICVYPLFSLFAGVLFISYHSKQYFKTLVEVHEISCSGIFTSCSSFTRYYWGLTFSNVFHTLLNYLPHILVKSWELPIIDAGYLCSTVHILPIFIAPLIGAIPLWKDYALFLCMAAGAATVLAYILLRAVVDSPIVPVLLISFAESLIPTLTVSLIPSTIPASVCGIAFGVLSIVDSVGVFFGNIFFGYLYDATHSYEAGLSVLCGLSVLSFCLVCLLAFSEYHYSWTQRFVVD